MEALLASGTGCVRRVGSSLEGGAMQRDCEFEHARDERDLEILARLYMGDTPKDIARAFNVSEYWVNALEDSLFEFDEGSE